jgi:tetratricopeptide (TPR) repeat protein
MEKIERMVRMKFPFLLVLFFIGVLPLTQAQDERRFIRKGTEKYNEGNFVESGNEYWKALDKNKNSLEARFNVAATMFKQEKYEDAIKQLQALSNQTNDKEILGKVYHNIGNSYLGLQELDKGIEAYKTALKNNPLDDETRYNLIAAMKMKDQQDKQDQQEQQQEQKKEEEQQEQEQEQEQNKDQQDQQQPPKEQEGISRENAERLLQAMEEDEKELQEKMNKKKEANPVRIDKNW